MNIIKLIPGYGELMRNRPDKITAGRNIYLTGWIFLLLVILSSKIFAQHRSLINTSHLDHLYEKIMVSGKSMGIIHIYADYPDYKYADAKGEGIACVDDAARAQVFYIRYYKANHDENVLDKIKNITNFLLYMQAKNGFFYNFIWNDYSIDSTYKTSVDKPDWWSWRAIWALSEAQEFFLKYDKKFAAKIKPQLKRAVNVTLDWLSDYKNNEYKDFEGFKVPGWLPYNYAADQAAILVKGLTVYYGLTKDLRVKKEIEKLCGGIIKMQFGSSDVLPYYAFLSWQNTWHAWGNSQADALICAGKVFKNAGWLRYAGNEIKHFYPYLEKVKYYNDFSIIKKNSRTTFENVNKYSQIAYGIRPMVFAALGYYKATRNHQSAVTAGNIACWLLGDNIAGIQMYNPKTGVCFDGIINNKEVNKNSGAESTVEALLSIQEAEQNPIAKKIIWDYYKKSENN